LIKIVLPEFNKELNVKSKLNIHCLRLKDRSERMEESNGSEFPNSVFLLQAIGQTMICIYLPKE
jgi:hypothetical protein